MTERAQKRRTAFPQFAAWKLGALSIALLCMVFALLYAAEFIPSRHPVLRSVVQSLAALILTSGIVSVIANLLVRRELARFWLDAIGVKESVERSGLIDVEVDFYAYDWRDLIRRAKQIDICVIHADKWIGNRLNDLRDFLASPEHELRACFLDEGCKAAAVLTSDFGYKDDELASKIDTAIRALKSCLEGKENNPELIGHLKIWKQERAPKHTYYRFDDIFVLVPYNQAAGRIQMPLFVFKRKRGGISDFLDMDFQRLLEDHAKLLYDSRAPAERA